MGQVSFNQPGIAPSKGKIKESIDSSGCSHRDAQTHTRSCYSRPPRTLSSTITAVRNALCPRRASSDPGQSKAEPRSSLPPPQRAPASPFPTHHHHFAEAERPGTPLPCLWGGTPSPAGHPTRTRRMPTRRQRHGHPACPAPPPLGGWSGRAWSQMLSSRSSRHGGPGWGPTPGVLTVPGTFPVGRMLGQASWRRDKPPHGAGMLHALATICPSPVARTAAQAGERGPMTPAEGQGDG